MLNKIRRARQLSPSEWAALADAAMALLRARIRFARVPVQQLIGDLKARSAAQPGVDPMHLADPLQLTRLSWAIGVAAAQVPWRSDCLIQVIAADQMLRRRGHTADFCLGLRKSEMGNLTAHAWLQCGDVVVTGGAVDGLSVILGPTRLKSDQ